MQKTWNLRKKILKNLKFVQKIMEKSGIRKKNSLLKNKFKYSLIKDPSETSSLENIKQQIITVSFFIQLTVVSVC